jgi:hypothetical protein
MASAKFLHQIVGRIAEENTQKNLPAQTTINRVDTIFKVFLGGILAGKYSTYMPPWQGFIIICDYYE